MLSYRHGFHAGNHADVLKHAIYHYVLNYLNQKNKPFSIVDTHAGAGAYTLTSDFSNKNKEYETGIAKLWHLENLPSVLNEYVLAVKQFNQQEGHDKLELYPGSPWFALNALPLEGKAFFHELHPSDFDLLRKFVRTNRYRKATLGDGFVESIGLYPPASKRGVTIIDPPYELKEDYQRVVEFVATAHKRFQSGVFLIWYPVVERQRIEQMEADFKKRNINNIQLFELNIQQDSDERGMTGSGMIVINPPWTLKAEMDKAMPVLVNLLGTSSASYRSTQLVAE